MESNENNLPIVANRQWQPNILKQSTDSLVFTPQFKREC